MYSAFLVTWLEFNFVESKKPAARDAPKEVKLMENAPWAKTGKWLLGIIILSNQLNQSGLIL